MIKTANLDTFKKTEDKILIPKILFTNPGHHLNIHYPLHDPKMEIENMGYDYWEIYFTEGLIKNDPYSEVDPDRYDIIFIKSEDTLIPIWLYSRSGGIDVDPNYRKEFFKRFTPEERRFLLGLLLYYQDSIKIYINSNHTKRDLDQLQSWICKYDFSKIAKRLRTGNNYYYDTKTRRKLESTYIDFFDQVNLI